MDVRILSNGIRDLEKDSGVANELGAIANTFSNRVSLPTSLLITTKKGIGPRGAFSQIIMRGPGAIAIEFGTSDTPPHAPLRRAIRTE